MPKCKKCTEDKEKSEFYKLNRVCKLCLKKDYQNNREDRIADSIRRQSEWRKQAINKLGGPKCVECGCEVYELLQINHKDGSGNKDRKENGMVSGKFWRAIAKETRDISNLEVTCRLCNQKHYVEYILGYPGFTIIYKAPRKVRFMLEKIFNTSIIGTIYSKLGFLSRLVSHIF